MTNPSWTHSDPKVRAIRAAHGAEEERRLKDRVGDGAGVKVFTVSNSAASPGAGSAHTSQPMAAAEALAFARQARDAGQRDVFVTDVRTGQRLNLVEFQRLHGEG